MCSPRNLKSVSCSTSSLLMLRPECSVQCDSLISWLPQINDDLFGHCCHCFKWPVLGPPLYVVPRHCHSYNIGKLDEDVGALDGNAVIDVLREKDWTQDTSPLLRTAVEDLEVPILTCWGLVIKNSLIQRQGRL